jgi:phospholipid-transporting ATPase
MEVVKFQQAQLINSDLDMYYAKTDTPALCRTSSLVEELGQIEYVFSDKTGTLTCNEMEFRCCSIAGAAYADTVDENKRDQGQDSWRSFAEMQALLAQDSNPFVDVGSSEGAVNQEKDVINEFLTLLAVCHTVIPEIRDGKTVYQASSPDEAALVAGAELLGYQFHVCMFTGLRNHHTY